MSSNRQVFYAGYDLGKDIKVRQVAAVLTDEPVPGTFRDLAHKELHFETDPDGHGIVRGYVESSTGLQDLECVGIAASVTVRIFPPRVGVEVAREFIRKVAKRRKLAQAAAMRRNRFPGNVVVFVARVSDELARTLLLKIADRMVERRGRYALRALPKAEKAAA